MARKKRARGKRGVFLPWLLLRRWILGLTLFSLMSAGALWGMLLLRDPGSFPLRVVRIDGQFRHLHRVELERVVSRAARGNFFTVDLEHIRNSVNRVPWVDRVSIRRIWPASLQMSVVEQVPLARWSQQSLLNARGERFIPRMEEIPKGLPRLEGPDGSEAEVFNRYRSMRPRLHEIGLEIALLRLDARRAWTITLNRGMEIRLGNSEVETRMRRFIRFYPQLVQGNQRWLKRMDLRYSNGFAVYWSEPEERISKQAGRERAS